MLAAIMGSAKARYANAVNLLTAAPWTVPAGVTTVYINAATAAAGPYFTDTAFGRYVGGGGGGALIVHAPLAVTPGQVIALSYTAANSSSGQIINVTLASILQFFIAEGQAGNSGGNGAGGGAGGKIYWGPTAETLDSGVKGTSGGAGGDGTLVTLSNGGFLLSGGGGGDGGTAVPPTPGGAGGSAGPYAGSSNLTGFGAGGGGYFAGSGQMTLGPGQTYEPALSSLGTTFLTVNY